MSDAADDVEPQRIAPRTGWFAAIPVEQHRGKDATSTGGDD
jgi:hypothetical protein